MAILNSQIDTIGQSGQIPKFIYLETDNSVGEITTAGFLNHFVAQGNNVSQTEMALVVTKEPSGAPTTGLYTISFASGDWSLNAVGGGGTGGAWLVGGNTIPALVPTAVFGTLNNESISFEAASIQYMFFDTSTNRLFINSANFQVDATGFASISAVGQILIESALDIIIGTSSTPSITIGNDLVPTNFTQINSPVIKMPNLTSSVTADVLYFNAGTGALTYGAAGGGGSGWLLTGNTGPGNVLGSTDVNGWKQVVNSVTYVDLSTTSYDITAPAGSFIVATGELTLQALANKVNVFANGKLNLGSVADAVEIDSFATLNAQGANVIIDTSVLGAGAIAIGTTNALDLQIGVAANSTTVNSAVFRATALPNASKPDVVFYDTATKQFSYDTAPSGGSDWNLSGTNSGGALLLGTNTTDGFGMQVNSVAIATFTTTDLLFGSMAYGAGLAIDSATGTAVIVGHAFTVNVDTGDVNINTRGVQTINLNGHGVGDTIAINIGTLLTAALNFGNSTCTIVGAANTFALTSQGNSSIVSANSDVILNAFSGDIILSALNVTQTANGTLSIQSPAIDLGLSPAAGVITLGNVFAGNNIVMNSADIKAPNLPVAVGGEKILMIAADGTLRVSP